MAENSIMAMCGRVEVLSKNLNYKSWPPSGILTDLCQKVGLLAMLCSVDLFRFCFGLTITFD